MTVPRHDGVRSLIVLSKDFGEIGVAMMLLRDQALAGGAHMLLPDSMFRINKDALPVPTTSYTTLDDILRVVDAHQPNIVFLLSGRLLAGDRLLSAEAVQTLLRRFRERGCCVVTSDPWLGMGPRVTIRDVDLRMHPEARSIFARWLLQLVQRLNPSRKVADVQGFENVIHLYSTSIPDSADETPRFAFFNPAIIRELPANASTAREGSHGPNLKRPRWLFLVSPMDVHVQSVLLGMETFTSGLLRLLRSALEANKDVTLIAPSSVVNRLGDILPESVEMLSSCPFPEFERRLLDAEYAFYWNAFSQSQQNRLANELPFFAFDRGHASRIVPAYYEIARSCHYGVGEPTFLDQTQRLDPHALHELAEKQRPVMRMLRERWQKSPTPDTLVHQLLERCAVPVGLKTSLVT